MEEDSDADDELDDDSEDEVFVEGLRWGGAGRKLILALGFRNLGKQSTPKRISAMTVCYRSMYEGVTAISS